MSAVYDWRAEGDFEHQGEPVADAVRRALVDVAAGRLPSLATLARAVGVGAARALAVRDHLAHLLAERDVCGRMRGTAMAGEPVAERADEPAESGPSPASTPVAAPDPDPMCPRALDEFAAELAEGRTPSLRQIRLRLHVGSPRATRIRGFLAAHARRAA